MAGALTANSITTDVDPGDIGEDETVIAAVGLLSPVDGANNVLLTAVIWYGSEREGETITFQWYRASTAGLVAGTALGAAVGAAWTLTLDAGGPYTDNAVVCVVDSGAGLTSGYALTAVGSAEDTLTIDALYVDAVLFD